VHKLLIVPDDILTVRLEQSFLDRRAVRTRSALNGEEALSIALVWQPAVVIYGSVLSDMTAATFVKRLRASVPTPGPQLIRITSSVGESAPEPDESLCDAHLIAPVEINQLLNTAAALLELRQRRWLRVRATVNVSLSGLLENMDRTSATPATTVDISEGGMRVEPREALSVGSSGSVTLVLPGSQTKLVLGCTVRALVDEMQLHYGLEFTNLTEQQTTVLRAFVQLHSPRRGRSR
jgi:DNA-binding response OmpR family regulator